MEAISALVNTCCRLKLNLFDSSFLKMVQLLLEQDLPKLQLLGTKSVGIFLALTFPVSRIFPNRRRCSVLPQRVWWLSCPLHSNGLLQVARWNRAQKVRLLSNKPSICARVRVAGIRGLQGVVRKTARDQLRMNALQSSSMEKIIPALLFNIHERHGLDLRH